MLQRFRDRKSLISGAVSGGYSGVHDDEGLGGRNTINALNASHNERIDQDENDDDGKLMNQSRPQQHFTAGETHKKHPIRTAATTNTSPRIESTLLDAIHVQIVPPSNVVDRRSQQRQFHYRHKLDQLSERHQHEQRLRDKRDLRPISPFSSTPITIDTTNTLMSSSASNNHSISEGENIRRVHSPYGGPDSHIVLCGADNPCLDAVRKLIENNTELNTTLLTNQSIEQSLLLEGTDSSIGLESQLKSVAAKKTTIIDTDGTNYDKKKDTRNEAITLSAYIDEKHVNTNCKDRINPQRHAYDYQPTPPQRRSRRKGANNQIKEAKAQNSALEPSSRSIGNVRYGKSRIDEPKRGEFESTRKEREGVFTKKLHIEDDADELVSPKSPSTLLNDNIGTFLIVSSIHGQMNAHPNESVVRDDETTLKNAKHLSKEPAEKSQPDVESSLKTMNATLQTHHLTFKEIQRALSPERALSPRQGPSPPRSSAPTMKHANGNHLIDRFLRNRQKEKENEINGRQHEHKRLPIVPRRLSNPTSKFHPPDPPSDHPKHKMKVKTVDLSAKVRPLIDPMSLGNNFTRQQQKHKTLLADKQNLQQQNDSLQEKKFPKNSSSHRKEENQELTNQLPIKKSRSTHRLEQQKDLQQKQPMSQPKTMKLRSEKESEELASPFPLKKSHSTPSNFGSSFTLQTSNTTSTSKFWDGIEDYQQIEINKNEIDKPISPTSPISPNELSFKSGLHGNPKKFKNIGRNDYVILKKLNEKNKHLQDFFKSYQSSDKDEKPSDQTMVINQNSNPIKPTQTQQKAPSIAAELDSMSNAFSLNLPMNRQGRFDDTDISALEMGDSATVYHLRARAEDQKKYSNYWKEKYDLLKEETLRAKQSKIIEKKSSEECNDDISDSRETVENELSRPCASPFEIVQHFLKAQDEANVAELINKSPVEDQSHYFQQQKSLFRCGYGGGKKARDAAKTMLHDDEKRLNTESALNKNSFARADSVSNIEMKSTSLRAKKSKNVEDTIGLKDPSGKHKKYSAFRPSIHVIDEGMIGSDMFFQLEDCYHGDKVDTDGDPSFESDSDTSHNKALRQVGFVSVETPSPNKKPSVALDETLTVNKTLEEGPPHSYHQKKITDDEMILQQWNKNRISKSLADDLTVGASRGMTSKESSIDESNDSELNENAKMIFEAALQYDVKTLRAQPFLSASRPTKSQSSGRKTGAKSVPNAVTRTVSPLSNVTSIVASASIISSHLVSMIPIDFASWFELPSPGSACIPLIPSLKGDLKNTVALELLTLFDRAANKIDDKVVYRIVPRNRVDDVVHQSFSEFMHSSSSNVEDSDREYTGLIDSDNGSITFTNASIHLRVISDKARIHIKKREFSIAIDIYHILLRSCQATSGSSIGLIGQVIASTLHNLCIMHLWNEEYDQALPYCRECLRMKKEIFGDNELNVNSWANLGLINYAMETHTPALSAFRKAAELSTSAPDAAESSQPGRLINNMACVYIEIGMIPLAQSEFEQSLRLQNDGSKSNKYDLMSISLTVYNLGVACVMQKQFKTAISHITACHATQQALLGASSECVESTSFYLKLLKSMVAPSVLPGTNLSPMVHNEALLPSSPIPFDESRQEKEGSFGTVKLNSERVLDTKTSILRHSKIDSSPKDQHVEDTEYRRNHDHPFTASTTSQNISYPMLALGGLKVEYTIVERVRNSLECCADNLLKDEINQNTINQVNRNNQKLRLLCKRHPSSLRQKNLSRKLVHYSIKTFRKRELQTELNEHLERYGPRHPLVGQSHHRMGLILLYTENYHEAIDHFDKSIRINTNALGVKHSDICSSLMYMGLAQLALEKFDEAMISMHRVRRSREDSLGAKSSEICQILNNLACIQFELGDLKRAESLFQEALDLQKEIFTTEPNFLKSVSIVLCNIAFVHAKTGSFSKALIELEGALQIRRDILFEDASIGDITENIAYILAIHHLQHGSGNLDNITMEYISMLQKS